MKMDILLIEKGLNIEETNRFVLGVATRKRIGLHVFHVPGAEKYVCIAVTA
jgi:hypothetical protein